jgi:hypothetical protein
MLGCAKSELEKASAHQQFVEWRSTSARPADELQVLSVVKEGDRIRGIVFSSINILLNVLQAVEAFGEKNLTISVDGTYRLSYSGSNPHQISFFITFSLAC